MSASRHSKRGRRESLHRRHEDGDYVLYSDHESQGDYRDFRTSKDMSLQKSGVYRERQYQPPHVPSCSSSRGHRDDFILYDDEITQRSRSPPRLTFPGEERPKGHKYRAQDESALVQRSRASLQGFSANSTRGQPEDYPRRVPGSRDTTKEPQYCGDLGKTLPRRSGERQPAYVPAAPVIPRLPSPDFYAKAPYDSDLAEYDFCPCCPPGVRDKRHDVRWEKGRAKMDRQVDHARAYISRVALSERLITDA